MACAAVSGDRLYWDLEIVTLRLLLVANPDESHIGGHLLAATNTCGIERDIVDSRAAEGSWLMQRLSRRLRDRRPARMRSFERNVIHRVQIQKPSLLLATGISSLSSETLREIRRLGTRSVNFLTDDPWNHMHRSRWFLSAIPEYDFVFSPRRSNLEDLSAVGCPAVYYLPFAYNPEQHHPEPDSPSREPSSDILFVGGADVERVPFLATLIRAGLRVSLFGGYWTRYRATRSAARGHASQSKLRCAVANARVVLILARRANRDGHVMRTFETAATRACMLVEDTAEHRAIFGDDNQCVRYFDEPSSMLEQARRLLSDASARQRLAAAAFDRIVLHGKNTYVDRLRTILGHVGLYNKLAAHESSG